MAAARTRLVRREGVAEGTMAFHLERPAGFDFQAGQNLNLSLGEGETRTFTIASAPHEPELMVATRMRKESTFKQRLATMPLTEPVTIDGPNGVMTLHEDAARPAVFIAGGIGITPFLAMARDAAHRRLKHPLTLLYSNRRPQDAAFLQELQRLPNLRLVARMTDAEGFMDEAFFRKHLADAKAPMVYLAGPPAMTMAVQGALTGIGVPDDAIRSEEFYGY
jgi:ferredoxin-NADP reductase